MKFYHPATGLPDSSLNFRYAVIHGWPIKLLSFGPVVPRVNQPFVAFHIQNQEHGLFNRLQFVNGAGNGQRVIVYLDVLLGKVPNVKSCCKSS
jgi:hypothetical protein